MKIVTLSFLIGSGKKVAFVKGNRKINPKNVKIKVESFKTYGGNLVPLMYVDGQKAVDDGCILVDTDGYEIAPENASEYIVIVDGQHRFMAALNAKLDKSKIFLFKSYADATTKELLAESNVAVSTWDNTAFINGAVLFHPECDVAQFANSLVEQGYNLTVISLIMCWASGKITRKKLADLIATGKIDVDFNKERAQLFLKQAETKFDQSFIAKRYLINSVIALSADEGYKVVCSQIPNLTDNDVKEILAARSDEKEKTISDCLKRLIKEAEDTKS